MSWITMIDPKNAEGPLRDPYARVADRDGSVGQRLQIHSLRHFPRMLWTMPEIGDIPEWRLGLALGPTSSTMGLRLWQKAVTRWI
jgi:hypothetical protein